MRLSALLVVALLVLPVVQALPTPGLNGAVTQATLGRIFPEALQTNDYVSFDEAVAGLQMLDEQAPDRVEIIGLGDSTGWVNRATGQREPRPLFAVEVTNEKSPVAAADKLTLVFFLSIHGNEKGGREGGLRVIEDLALGIGLAAEEPELIELLDFQKISFIFANSDGWTHEEVPYRASDANPQQFTRENGNNLDLNRQFPTVGYLYEGYTPLSESESRAMVNYTQTLTNVVAGADMHGMLTNSNLVRLLLKDGQKSQQQLFENERIAELYKERLNANPHYVGWETAPGMAGVCCGQVAEWAATFDAIGYSASGTAGAWIVQRQGLAAPGYTVEYAYNHIVTDNYYPGAGAQFNDYHVEATRDIVSVFMRFAAEKVNLALETHGKRTLVLSTSVVATSADDDASSYGGWFTENAHDDLYDIANNAFTASQSEYWQDAQRFVKAGELAGVLTLSDDVAGFLGGLSAHDNVVVPGSASDRLLGDANAIAQLRAFVEAGGSLVLTDQALRLLEPLGIVAAGSVDHKLAYSGYTDLVDRQHPLAANLKGWPRQTYDPNPLGFAPDTSPVWFVDRAAWEGASGVTVGAVAKKGSGEAVTEDPSTCAAGPLVPLRYQQMEHDHAGEAHSILDLQVVRAPVVVPIANGVFEPGADCQELDATNVGLVKLGAGTVHVFGAILPDATEDANHPYGLDGHAVAANGNLLLLNMLGMEYVYSTPPAIEEYGFARTLRGEPDVEPASTDAPARVPGPGAALVLALVVGVALGLARRK